MTATASRDYDLAVEIAKSQQLIKGYSDTHQRGLKNFSTLMETLDARPDMTADQLMALQVAALADEKGETLQTAIDELDERTALAA
ncbi:MAG: DUF6537 domain-containing protein [Pseudomonadota bacterium]